MAMKSLRARLTAAVMMPLLALALTFGGITCWMIYRTISTAADRELVGAATTLSQAMDADGHVREEVLPLAVSLLQSQSAQPPIFSIHDGDRLVAGSGSLPLPPDYNPGSGAGAGGEAVMAWHEPPSFPKRYQRSDPQVGRDVIQPAYLREGALGGRALRIAAEIRLPRGSGRPVLVQTAEFLDQREAMEQTFYLRVAGAGILIVMISLLLFYGAITWGLRPFASLTSQIDAARQRGSGNVRVILANDDPREAQLLAGAFNDLMVRNDRATHSLRQFTANASHQLRTPLTIVRVHADVLARYGPSTPQGATALADIVSSVDALDHLLNQLISLARMDEQGRPGGKLTPFALSELVATIVAGRVTLPDAARMDIGYEADAPTITALGDEQLAAEMIGNLLDNAVRYNRPDGTVTVRVLARAAGPVVEVEDDGPGIAAAHREKVWERFYRAPGADSPPGSGLGLPIVRALADRISARVTLEDGADGRGVRAVIVFRGVPGEPALPADDFLVRSHG